MTKLLGIQNYHYLGFEILTRMANGQDMIANHYFPKVSHCDFKVRELGNDHQYTVSYFFQLFFKSIELKT